MESKLLLLPFEGTKFQKIQKKKPEVIRKYFLN